MSITYIIYVTVIDLPKCLHPWQDGGGVISQLDRRRGSAFRCWVGQYFVGGDKKKELKQRALDRQLWLKTFFPVHIRVSTTVSGQSAFTVDPVRRASAGGSASPGSGGYGKQVPRRHRASGQNRLRQGAGPR